MRLPRSNRAWLFTVAAGIMLVYLVAQGRNPAVIIASALRLLGHLS